MVDWTEAILLRRALHPHDFAHSSHLEVGTDLKYGPLSVFVVARP